MAKKTDTTTKSKEALIKAKDGTITLTIAIPAAAVVKAREEAVDEIVKNTTIDGFRKGMAPKEAVEKRIDKAQLQEDILRKLLPEYYTKAVEEHKLRPIVSPKIHIEKTEEGSDWEFSAITCEMPEVTLSEYKKKVQDISAKAKIIVPGKEPAQPNFDEIIKTILESTKITIPQILIDSEVDRFLAQLLDEIKTLGLSLDQYLSSTHKTIEDVKKEFETRAINDISFEFALSKIADEEKINVEPKELQEALDKAQSPEERANLERNIYLLASILRQQKTLDYLKNL